MDEVLGASQGRLVGLVERLERATGPDRELDELIAPFDGWQLHGSSGTWIKDYGHPVGDRYHIGAPKFTESIDDALTLVPEEWRVEHIGEQLSGGRWDVEFHWREYSQDACIQGNGAAPAIAVCVAALKAISAQGPRQAPSTPSTEGER